MAPSDPHYGLHPLGGLTAPNLTRIVVEGSTNPTEYLRLTVDPRPPASSPGPGSAVIR